MGGAEFRPQSRSPGFEHFFKTIFFVKSDPSDNFWHPKDFASKIFAHPNLNETTTNHWPKAKDEPLVETYAQI